jgi:hypothetical protein
MARRATQPPADDPPYLTIPREEANRKIAARVEGGTELKSRPIGDHPTFEDRQSSFWTWNGTTRKCFDKCSRVLR